MKRSTIILLIAGILLIVAVVVAFVYSSKDSTTDTTNSNTAVNAPVVNVVANTNTSPSSALSQEQEQQNEAVRAASIFTEQYGTYTGGFNTSVMNNLTPLVTDAYAKTLAKTVVASGSNDEAVSVDTQVLNTTLSGFSLDTSAQVTVSTLRTQSAGADATPTQLSQEITITEVYTGGRWLVSSAEWKTPKSIDSL